MDTDKSPLAKVLLGVATILTIWSLVSCYLFIRNVREFRALQFEASRLSSKQQLLTLLVNEAAEYGKTHPAIEPLLQTLRAPKAAPAGAPTQPTSPKGATK